MIFVRVLTTHFILKNGYIRACFGFLCVCGYYLKIIQGCQNDSTQKQHRQVGIYRSGAGRALSGWKIKQ
jgi:hypothetical protein